MLRFQPFPLRGKGIFAPLSLLSPQKYFIFLRGPLCSTEHGLSPFIPNSLRESVGCLGSERACKPGSVERGHLSTPAVTDRLKRYSRTFSGGQPYVKRSQTCIGRGLHGTGRYRPVGELLPRLSSFAIIRLATDIGRSISVALSLGSPPPDVIRRPALRCPDFPHRAHGTPRPRSPLGSPSL